MSNRSSAARASITDATTVRPRPMREASRRPASSPAHTSTPAPPTRHFDLLTDVMDQVRLEGTIYFRTVCNGEYGIRIERRGRTPFYAVREGEAEIRLLDR